MKRKIVFNLFIFLTACFSSYAQTGSISGTVTDNNNIGLPGASVVIDGTTQGAMSDLDGNFKIAQVKPGTYILNISYVGYVTQRIENVIVTEGVNKSVAINLKENINQLQGTEVVAQRTTHTENAVLMEVKQSEQIVNGISRQQITRSQDRSAIEVVRRIPGITVMDNGYVIIRGLNERYNTTMLNGIIAPSMEADKKAFALDVVPTAMLDRLLIYKTGAPEITGDFAGGVVKIITKNPEEENQVSVGYTTSYRANTTFNDFYQAPRGNTDWLGTDDGTRSLPASFPNSLSDVQSLDELTDLGRQLPNAWTAAKIKAGPDQRFNATLVNNFKFGKLKAGNITSLQYGLTYESNTAKNYNYNTFNPETQSSDTIYAYNDETYKENVRLSLIHNWTFFVSSKTKIDFRNFFFQQGSNQTILREGPNYEVGSLEKNYAYRYQERTLYSGQLTGSHDVFADRTKIDWTLGYSFAHSAEPDYRRLRTQKPLDAVSDSIPYQMSIPPSASTLDAGRYYSDLNEHIATAVMNFEHALKSRDEALIPKLRAGFYTEMKQREFSARWMSYKRATEDFDNNLLYLPLDQIFASDNINDSTGFKLEEGTNPSDHYDAGNILLAGYVGVSWPFTDKINVSGGIRYEYNRQRLESINYNYSVITIDNPISSILPSLNISYNFTKKMLVRVAYSKTVNRPEFRELAPFSYYDFTFNNLLEGNIDLKTPDIHNYDVRWEFYPTSNDLITVGAFYKKFLNPIEMFYNPEGSSGATRNFTYDNADDATSLGLEIELKKYLISLFDTTGRAQGAFMKKFVSRLGVSFNAALIASEVNLGDEAVGQSKNRPMMGQSPYIFNAGLFFSNVEKKFQVTALYNIIGKRIFGVGSYGTPDIYYMPRNSIDLTINKGIGKYFEIKAGVQDLLAQDEVYKQDSNENGKIDSVDDDIMVIRKGAYYSLGVVLKF